MFRFTTLFGELLKMRKSDCGEAFVRTVDTVIVFTALHIIRTDIVAAANRFLERAASLSLTARRACWTKGRTIRAKDCVKWCARKSIICCGTAFLSGFTI